MLVNRWWAYSSCVNWNHKILLNVFNYSLMLQRLTLWTREMIHNGNALKQEVLPIETKKVFKKSISY